MTDKQSTHCLSGTSRRRDSTRHLRLGATGRPRVSVCLDFPTVTGVVRSLFGHGDTRMNRPGSFMSGWLGVDFT